MTRSTLVALAFALASQGFAQTPSIAPAVPTSGIAAAPPASAPVVDEVTGAAPPLPELPFSWGNKLPSFVRRGNELYTDGDFTNAEHDFSSARLLDPGVAAPTFNLGLTAARQDHPDDAVVYFESAADLAREDDDLRAKALYNKGVVRFQQAREALDKKQDKRAAIIGAIEALDAFRGAEFASKDFEEAAHNRALVQDFLRKLPVSPPEQQQQQQQQDEQKQDDQQQQNQQTQEQQQSSGSQSPEDQSEQPQQSPQDQQDQNQEQPQDGQQQDEQNKPDQQQQSQPRQDKPEPSKNEGEKQDVRPEGPGEKEKESQGEQGKMTPEEARQLLNMLEDGEKIRLTKGRNPKANPKGKPW